MKVFTNTASFALITLSVISSTHDASAQPTYYTTLDCPRSSVFAGEYPVYFVADTLQFHGFDPDEFRSAVIRAINVWNEEVRAAVRLRYAGDAPGGIAPNRSITIYHPTQAACSNSPTALAITTRSGEPCNDLFVGRISISMDTEDCGGGTLLWNPTIASSSEWSYEAFLIHELGHALLNAPDISLVAGVCPNTGVMCAQIDFGIATRHLHLYPIDQATARLVYPDSTTSEGALATIGRYNPYLGSWSAIDRSFGGSTTMSAGLGRTTDWTHRPSVEIFRSSNTSSSVRVGAIENRDYSSLYSTHTPPSSITTNESVVFWPRIATSVYGEFFLTWLACTAIDTPCRVNYAYTDQPGVASSWITGNFSTFGSYAPAEIAYDQQRDRFVVIALDSSSMLPLSAYTSAYRPQFALSTPTDARDSPWTDRLRYTGGLAIDPNTTPEDGQWVASTTMGVSPRRVAISRLYLTYNQAWGAYVVSQPTAADPNSWFETPRHFGQARIGSSHDLFMVWLRGDGQQSLAASLSNGPGVNFLPATNLAQPGGVTSVISGTTTTLDYDYTDGYFAVSFSSY